MAESKTVVIVCLQNKTDGQLVFQFCLRARIGLAFNIIVEVFQNDEEKLASAFAVEGFSGIRLILTVGTQTGGSVIHI